MSFEPKYGKPLSEEEAVKFRTIRSEVNKTQPKTSLMSNVFKAANGISDFFGFDGITKQYGASLARTKFRLQGRDDLAQMVDNPSMKEVAGSALQAGANFIPGAGVSSSLLRKAGVSALTGYAVDVGSDLQKGESIGESIKPGAGAVIGGAVPFVGQGFRAFGKYLEKGGDKIQFSVIKPNQSDIADGFLIENVKKHNLGGSLPQTLKKSELKLNDLSTQLDSKLESATEKIDLNSVYEKTVKKMLGNKLETFGANSQLDNALDRLHSEVVQVVGDTGALSLKEANKVKRATGHFGAWQYGKIEPEAQASEKVYSAFYSELKKEIENKSPEGVRELNKQMSEIIPILNATIRRIPIAERNNLISLTDIITLSASSINPSAGLLTLANIASKSGRVGSAVSKTGARIKNSQGATKTIGNVSAKLAEQSMVE